MSGQKRIENPKSGAMGVQQLVSLTIFIIFLLVLLIALGMALARTRSMA